MRVISFGELGIHAKEESERTQKPFLLFSLVLFFLTDFPDLFISYRRFIIAPLIYNLFLSFIVFQAICLP
jgi:hypothetical protein